MANRDSIRTQLVKDRIGIVEDNLYRARAAGKRTVDVTAPWGDSGRSLADIIRGYEEELADLKTAL